MQCNNSYLTIIVSIVEILLVSAFQYFPILPACFSSAGVSEKRLENKISKLTKEKEKLRGFGNSSTPLFLLGD